MLAILLVCLAATAAINGQHVDDCVRSAFFEGRAAVPMRDAISLFPRDIQRKIYRKVSENPHLAKSLDRNDYVTSEFIKSLSERVRSEQATAATASSSASVGGSAAAGTTAGASSSAPAAPVAPAVPVVPVVSPSTAPNVTVPQHPNLDDFITPLSLCANAPTFFGNCKQVANAVARAIQNDIQCDIDPDLCDVLQGLLDQYILAASATPAPPAPPAPVPPAPVPPAPAPPVPPVPTAPTTPTLPLPAHITRLDQLVFPMQLCAKAPTAFANCNAVATKVAQALQTQCVIDQETCDQLSGLLTQFILSQVVAASG